MLRVKCCSNKYVKTWKWLFNWVMGRGWKSFKVHAKNMDIKGKSVKVSDGNEDHVTGKGGNIILVIK